MSWQKCPVCDGTGKQQQYGQWHQAEWACDVCGGAKIISEVTGRPPELGLVSSDPTPKTWKVKSFESVLW